jgi:hypothetical protein
MKIYVVETCDGIDDIDHKIEGVFSSEDKAREAERYLEADCIITELEIDEITIADSLMGRVGNGCSTMKL